jgi:gluconate 5-dehydrogenase
LLLSGNWEAPCTAAGDNRKIVDRYVHPGVRGDPLSCRRLTKGSQMTTDHVAIVTGANHGIGAATARALARRGCAVVCAYFRVIDPAEPGFPQAYRDSRKSNAGSVLGEIISSGGRAIAMEADLSDPATPALLFDLAERQLGPVDILVNNAAVNQRQSLEQFSLEQWRAVQAANLDGPFLVTRAVLPEMKARRRGKIINICSLASDIGRPNIVPYAASKGGVKMLTRALAVELAPHNVQVNGIAPGFFKTEMNAPLIADAEFSAWVARRTPAGRWGEPPEIAGAAVFLASGAADYVTGHLLYVDGGFSAAY